MAALTIKNIPDELYEALKQTAAEHHRSINSEVIATLSRKLLTHRITTDEKEEQIADIRRVRANIPAKYVTEDILNAAKNEGRA